MPQYATSASSSVGKLEPREQVGPAREPGDRGDPFTLDCKHHHAVGAIDPLARFVRVRGKRRLPIRPRRYEADPVEPAVERDRGEECADARAPFEPGGLGRHRQQRVVREQGNESFDIHRCPRILEEPHHPFLGLRVEWLVHAVEAALPSLLLEPLSASLQRAVDRRDAVLEQLTDLARRPAEHVAEHDHDALLGWQKLHRGDERQADPLAFLRQRVRTRRARRDCLEQAVGIRLEVGIDERLRAPVALLDQSKAHVGRDPVEPGAQWGAWLEPVDAAPGAQHCLLEGIVRIVERPEHPVAVNVKRLSVRARQLHERLLVAAPRGEEQGAIGAKVAHPDVSGAVGRDGEWAAELRPCRRLEGAWNTAKRDELDAVFAGNDLAQLLRSDANHHPGGQLDDSVVGVQDA